MINKFTKPVLNFWCIPNAFSDEFRGLSKRTHCLAGRLRDFKMLRFQGAFEAVTDFHRLETALLSSSIWMQGSLISCCGRPIASLWSTCFKMADSQLLYKEDGRGSEPPCKSGYPDVDTFISQSGINSLPSPRTVFLTAKWIRILSSAEDHSYL